MIEEKQAADELAVPIGLAESESAEFGVINPQIQHEEWNRAWGCIKRAFGDYDCLDEDSHETWQYMGSYRDGDRWFHQFRHRALRGAEHYSYRS